MNRELDGILTEADRARFAALKVLNIAVRPTLRDKLASGGKWLVLLGHSAGGKSAVLRHLGVSRDVSDMDVFCQQRKLKKCAATLDRLCAEGQARGGLIALSNEFELLDEIEARQRSNQTVDHIFLYIKRPMSILFENLKLKNTDGIHHRKVTLPDYTGLYEQYDIRFRKIADIEIDYAGHTIEDLADIVSQTRKRITESIGDRHPRQASIATEKGTSRVQEATTDDETANLFSPEAPDTDPFFRDYNDLRTAARANPAVITLPSQSDMREMTAGGYQVFDAGTFPPLPDNKSTARYKLADLKWTEPEFAGMRVLEIGSQLGFFAFHAFALGASTVLGIEQNSRFAKTANKFALHYKKLCRWEADPVRFANIALMPGDAIPRRPDVIVANSIVHWWIIQDETARVATILEWLKAGCDHGVYFEGCVDASEPIMKQNVVAPERYNERDFVKQCERIFRKVQFVGRCSYNDKRIVLRLLK